MDEAVEEAAQPNAWRVYHVETGEALATHHDIDALAHQLSGLKSGDAVIVRAVVADKGE